MLARTNILICTKSHFMRVFDGGGTNQDPRPLPPTGGRLSDEELGRTMRGFGGATKTFTHARIE
ncbi:MAG TPA: hypothetical protein VIS76_11690 [Pseudomonadales bacterium]